MNITTILMILLFTYAATFICTRNSLAQTAVPQYVDSITTDVKDGPLSMPFLVKLSPELDEIYVIDTRGRIIIYSSALYPLYVIDKKYGIDAPQGLAVDTDGMLYIAQAPTKNNPVPRITVLNPCLTWNRDILLKGFQGAETFIPRRIALDRHKNIYVATGRYSGVVILDNSGKFLEILGHEEDGRKVRVMNVIIDRSGRIYLVSEEQGHIYVFSKDREFLFKFGTKGGSEGKLSKPKSVGIDSNKDMLYIADYMRHTISVYNSEGAYQFEFGGLGWNRGWFQHPMDIAIDDKGRIFVADFFNNRIQVFANR